MISDVGALTRSGFPAKRWSTSCCTPRAWKPRSRHARKCLGRVRRIVPTENKTRVGFLPLTNEFRIDMARLEIPVSGWTCFRTGKQVMLAQKSRWRKSESAEREREKHTLVDVGGVGLLARLGALLLLASGGGLLAGILLLGSLGGSGGGLGGGLLVGLGRHFENRNWLVRCVGKRCEVGAGCRN